MNDQILLLSLRHKKEVICRKCRTPLLNVGVNAKSNHTLVIPNKDEGIEIKCPACKSVNAFNKKECINKKVRCLKCDKVLGEAYPGMPDEIDPLGKKTVFYKLKIVCPNPECCEVNEFRI